MHAPRPSSFSQRRLIGPKADPDFAAIASPSIRWRVRLAHAVHRLQQGAQNMLGKPISKLLLSLWMRNWPGAAWVERRGLPRHHLASLLGEQALILHLDPRRVIQFAMHPPGTRRKPPSWAFLHDGDWDLCRVDLRADYALDFVRDLVTHRHALHKTARYREYMQAIQAGRPYRSHQEGFVLDTREQVLGWLNIYLGFLDRMAEHGYDEHRAKDYPGIAITREGKIVKVRRGAHRLAMAQWLGLPQLPMQIHYVHRLWWEKVTDGHRGEAALARIRQALAQAQPETQPGPLTTQAPLSDADKTWPPAITDPGSAQESHN